ncbi:MAG: Crp/Fnr family transcriptional regulator [Cyclobacteriaceae bacterium]
MIPTEILEKYNSQIIAFKKDEYIFYENEKAHAYFQVHTGSVKMSSFSADGQEFIQGFFGIGESFGDPALFGEFPYPNNAIAVENAEVAKLPKDIFFDLLRDNFDLHKKFNHAMSHRLRYKAMLLKEISSYWPEHIIMTLLQYLRDHKEDRAINEEFMVPYTRQQIADMTGLRVETVIRAVKKLAKQGKLEIKAHKIHLASKRS